MKTKPDDFFIGWSAKMPGRLKAQTTLRVAVLCGLGFLLLLGISLAQGGFKSPVAYEWASPRTLEGEFRLSPYPVLRLHVPGTSVCRALPIVNELKEGWSSLDPQLKPFDGQAVAFTGGVIHRGEVAMLEGNPRNALQLLKKPQSEALLGSLAHQPEAADLGHQVLTGEIVDSKCAYGAMNPGSFKAHRECAIVCLKGGIPPVLAVRRSDKTCIYLMLVDEQGSPLGDSILPFVAEPVSVSGNVSEQCGLLLMNTDASRISRR